MPQVSEYNHTRRLFANGDVDPTQLKVMLLTGHTFSAAHTNISSVEGDEVSGNGWAAGGVAIANASITTVATDQARLAGDNINVTADGGQIGPATAYVIYQDVTGSEVTLFHCEFDEAKTADDGTPFRITWHPDGIHVWRAPNGS